ncbi:MAG: Wzz/FepE/Etk N-terminal domain-containing protein [Acidobacteria bacterium]|nr:Wzz/FepE/Etk N-terminal domain-containing protein [Acidobacteriota bacterium]
METLIPQVSTRDLALVLFKRKWSVTVIVLVTMFAAAFWLFVIRDELYTVSTRVLVKLGREQAPPPSVMGAAPMVIAYRSQDLNSEIEIFRNLETIGRVVDKYHLDVPAPDPVPTSFLERVKLGNKILMRTCKEWYEEALIRMGFRERLSPREKTVFGLALGLAVKAQKDSNVFEAELSLPYRKGSAEILNALLDEYLSYRQEIYKSTEAVFFKSEVDSAARKLQSADTTVQKFEEASDISSFQKQESVLLENIAAARAAWKEADATRQELEGRVGRLEEELRKSEPNFARIAEFGHQGFQQTVLNQLAELQRERERLRMTELDSGDKIQNNRQQYQALVAMLAGNLRTAHAEVAQQTEVRRTAFENLRDQLKQLHDKETQWTQLKRKQRDHEEDYLLFRKKLEESRANAGMELLRIGNVAVIERASAPLMPSGLRKTTMLGLALLSSLLAALTWVTIAEFFDYRVYRSEELERIVPVPVLAVIPAGVHLMPSGGTAREKLKTSHVHGITY